MTDFEFRTLLRRLAALANLEVLYSRVWYHSNALTLIHNEDRISKLSQEVMQ
jgi:hypothetical protein